VLNYSLNSVQLRILLRFKPFRVLNSDRIRSWSFRSAQP